MAKEKKLTQLQEKLLKYIQDYRDNDENGETPTTEQIAEYMGFKFLGSATTAINALVKKGYIKLGTRRRMIYIVKEVL